MQKHNGHSSDYRNEEKFRDPAPGQPYYIVIYTFPYHGKYRIDLSGQAVIDMTKTLGKEGTPMVAALFRYHNDACAGVICPKPPTLDLIDRLSQLGGFDVSQEPEYRDTFRGYLSGDLKDTTHPNNPLWLQFF